jgi:glutathione S-transferase
MPNLTLYTNPMSRGRIARWMLEETGAHYETILLDYATSMKSPDYLAINPMGKVPAITHDGVTITENAAICAYLADAFPAAKLAPPQASLARGPYYRWLFFTAGPYEAAVTNKTFNFQLPPGREMSAGYGSYEAVMDTLDNALTNTQFLAGDHFTAADLYLAAQLSFGLMFNTIDKRPSFQAFVDLHTARPAYRHATQIDNDLMPKPK